jgi:hypothetical protein
MNKNEQMLINYTRSIESRRASSDAPVEYQRTTAFNETFPSSNAPACSASPAVTSFTQAFKNQNTHLVTPGKMDRSLTSQSEADFQDSLRQLEVLMQTPVNGASPQGGPTPKHPTVPEEDPDDLSFLNSPPSIAAVITPTAPVVALVPGLDNVSPAPVTVHRSPMSASITKSLRAVVGRTDSTASERETAL